MSNKRSTPGGAPAQDLGEVSPQRFRVILIDDIEEHRETYSYLISNDRRQRFEVVATVKIPDLAEKVVDSLNPDVVAVDLNFKDPRVNGVMLADRIRKGHPKIGILLVTGEDQRIDDIFKFMKVTKGGGRGFVIKTKDDEELLDCLSLVARGGEAKGSTCGAAYDLYEQFDRHCDELDFKILKYLWRGKGYKAISTRVALAEGTVTLRVRNMVDNMDIPDADEDGDQMNKQMLLIKKWVDAGKPGLEDS